MSNAHCSRGRPPSRAWPAVATAVALGTACGTPAPVTVSLSHPVTVPVEIYHNRVYLPARIDNSSLVAVVLDNGASVSGVRDSVARALGIRSSRRATLLGNGRSTLSIELADDVTFDVGGAAVREPFVAILPYDEFARHEGRLNAGVLGKDTYARFVVDVDYAAHTLTLRDPSTFTYSGSGIVIPLHVRRDARSAWMAARITVPGSGPVDARLGLDMGTYSALRLYSPFVKRRALLGAASGTVATYGFGLGGEFPIRLMRVDSLAIGNLRLRGPVAELSTADSGATAREDVDGTIGGAILSRFRVIVDYAHARMILEPNPHTDAPYVADMSGLVLDASGPGFATITVGHVLPTSPAFEAGFAVGDQLVSIDGEGVDRLGLARVRALLMRQAAYHITVARGSLPIELVLRTRPMI